MAKARRVNVEGSAFQFIHRKSSLSSQKRFGEFAAVVQWVRTRNSECSQERLRMCAGEIEFVTNGAFFGHHLSL